MRLFTTWRFYFQVHDIGPALDSLLLPSQENQKDAGPFTLKLEGEHCLHKLVAHVLDVGILVKSIKYVI
jgi:hypothetical protein